MQTNRQITTMDKLVLYFIFVFADQIKYTLLLFIKANVERRVFIPFCFYYKAGVSRDKQILLFHDHFRFFIFNILAKLPGERKPNVSSTHSIPDEILNGDQTSG